MKRENGGGDSLASGQNKFRSDERRIFFSPLKQRLLIRDGKLFVLARVRRKNKLFTGDRLSIFRAQSYFSFTPQIAAGYRGLRDTVWPSRVNCGSYIRSRPEDGAEETGRNCNTGRDFNLVVMGKRNFPAVQRGPSLSTSPSPSLSFSWLDLAFYTRPRPSRASVPHFQIPLPLKIIRSVQNDNYNGTGVARSFRRFYLSIGCAKLAHSDEHDLIFNV